MQRRTFLKTLAGGAASAWTLPRSRAEDEAAPPKPDWTLRLSTSSIHYLHLPIEEACARIARLGFESIDVWSAHAGCPHLDDVKERLGPEGLKALLAKHKLSLYSFSVYRGGFPRYAQLLGDAGGGVAVRGSTRPADPEGLTRHMRQFIEKLKPEVELAEKHDCRLAIENHGRALLDSLDSFKAFTDLNTSPRLGIALAPYHLQRIGASVEEAIRICGSQLFFFYAWQKAKGKDQLPGHGPTDFTPWVAALAGIKYPGTLNPFMHGDVEPDVMSSALARSRDYLAACAAKVRGERVS
jgi:sugar phosphate isomerase/epimerase